MGDYTSTPMAEHTGRSTSATGSGEVAIALADPPANPIPRANHAQPRHSLAELAELDLDAALQLLAERAQYITGASGAAIALRRGQHNDMLCRASVGSSAPGLGALLSMEYGLSGESVRHHKTLHCDDAERDSRVSRDACRQLGIASVVIMPIVCEEQAVGVLEVFSGTRHAFAERDFTALQRLSGMVETAVKHAVLSRQMMAASAQTSPKPAPGSAAIIAEQIRTASYMAPCVEDAAAAQGETIAAAIAPAETGDGKRETINRQTDVQWQTAGNDAGAEKVSQKPLYWSIAMQAPRQEPAKEAAGPIPIPETLRNLQKCRACGFPVSPGRSLCVECEERQWRGLPVRRAQAEKKFGQESVEKKRTAQQPRSEGHGEVQEVLSGTGPDAPENLQSTSAISARSTAPATPEPSSFQPGSAPHDDSLFLSATAHSGPWFAANKYILIPLLLVATVIAAVIVMR
jgi:hypothetical protein